MIFITGILEKRHYQNPDTHYTVARFKVQTLEDPITIVGHLAGVSEGETLKISGKWGTHSRYGEQFTVLSYEIMLPATLPGIKTYLSSGIISGLGPGMADRIVTHFRERTLDIIENEPGRLMEVSGIGKAKKEKIEKAWNEHHRVRRVMKFLQNAGISISHAAMILTQYGSQAIHILETDPFRIARDIPRNGFKIADCIARHTGIPDDHPDRIMAFVLNYLALCESDGHVFVFQDDIVQQCSFNLGIDDSDVILALEGLEIREEITIETGRDGDPARVYRKKLYQAEKGIFNHIRALLSMPPPEFLLEKEQIIEMVLSRLAVQLSDEQLDVICQVMTHRTVVITGGPGTGKTTLIRSLCTVFQHRRQHVLLSAPTGRAARKLSEVTGKKAFTLHKILGYDAETGCFEKNRANPLDMDVYIVDEASMVDTELMFHLLEAVPVQSILILVGDTFQLPSVGPGNVLADIIDSGAVKTFSLTRIFRQAQKSPIVMNAHHIRNGRMPDLEPPEKAVLSEFYFIENSSPSKVVTTIIDLCTGRIKNAFSHIDEIQVLTPMHKGEAGTINLNQRLQQALNPDPGGMAAGMFVFKPGDKVMHLKNNYEKDVFNGDIGIVHSFSKSRGILTVNYDGRLVTYEGPESDELALAYTISIHKSQGSEYTAVIIALTMNHFPLLQRNLLYTAITRGRDLVIIVGSKKAFETALYNDNTQKRRSGLKQRLETCAVQAG